MSGWVQEVEGAQNAWVVRRTISLREELSNLKEEKGLLVAENKITLALEMDIFHLKTTTGSIVAPVWEVKAHVDETERDMKKDNYTITRPWLRK